MRPSEAFSAAMTRHLGLDLGGTNIKHVVVERSGDDWKTLGQGETPTPHGGPEPITDELIDLGRQAIARFPDIATVGVGVPGRYHPDSGVTVYMTNLPGAWDGFPMGPRIAAALGLPASLINDARAFGLAELRLGAGRGATSMVGMALGTGVGGVIAVDGHVYMGHDGSAGEFGHQTIDPNGPSCHCGSNGCLESFTRADRLAAACGAATAEEAVERARAGDATALAGFASVGRYLGIGIANMITIVTPDRVVIGGGVSAAGDLLLDPIRAEVAKRVKLTSIDNVSFALTELGTWAGAIGAAIHGAEVATR
jgi:glucokinase